MAKKVLVTGYAGFLGQNTVSALRNDGWQIILAGRTAPEAIEHLSYLRMDLEEPGQILELRDKCHPDAIVHLACKVGWSGESEELLFTPNALATGCFAHLAKHWKARMVFASAAVIHGASTQNISRQSPLDPDTAYARSKLLAEELISASGIQCCTLRMGGLFGLDGPGHLGLNRAISGAIGGTRPTVAGAGDARRNYLYVKDAAAAIVAALSNGIEGIHLLAGNDVLAIKEMLQHICDVFLAGQRPDFAEGGPARDQIISSSGSLPRGRGFREALLDISGDIE